VPVTELIDRCNNDEFCSTRTSWTEPSQNQFNDTPDSLGGDFSARLRRLADICTCVHRVPHVALLLQPPQHSPNRGVLKPPLQRDTHRLRGYRPKGLDQLHHPAFERAETGRSLSIFRCLLICSVPFQTVVQQPLGYGMIRINLRVWRGAELETRHRRQAARRWATDRRPARS